MLCHGDPPQIPQGNCNKNIIRISHTFNKALLSSYYQEQRKLNWYQINLLKEKSLGRSLVGDSHQSDTNQEGTCSTDPWRTRKEGNVLFNDALNTF